MREVDYRRDCNFAEEWLELRLPDELVIEFAIQDSNPSDDKISILLFDTMIQNKTFVRIDTGNHTEGKHQIVISAQDRADNKNQKIITFELDRTKQSTVVTSTKFDYNFVLLGIAGAVAIGIASFIAFGIKSRKSSKS